MSGRLVSWLPAAVLIAVLALLLAQVPLVIASGDSLVGVWGSLALELPFALVGAVVAWRQPRNPVGWLLMGVIVTYAVSGDAASYEILVYRNGHSGWPLGPVSIALEPIWIGLILLPPVAILLFPDGHLPSRRWRWMLGAYIAIESVCATATVGVALAATINGSARVTADGDLTVIAATNGWFHGVQSVALVTAGLSAVVWIGMQVVRWRRASGELRQQLKWLMSGAAICIATVAFLLVGPLNNSANAWNFIGPVGIAALPAAIGVGILRYRLYEIDVIVRKTLVYSALVAVLAGLYLGGILLIGRGLRDDHRSVRGAGGDRVHAGRGGRLPAAATAHPADRRPPLLPRQVRRGRHPGGVHQPAPGPDRSGRPAGRGAGRGPGHRPAQARQPVAAAGPQRSPRPLVRSTVPRRTWSTGMG